MSKKFEVAAYAGEFPITRSLHKTQNLVFGREVLEESLKKLKKRSGMAVFETSQKVFENGQKIKTDFSEAHNVSCKALWS